MTKKNIILLLVMVCFLTMMAMSIWGKEPELPQYVGVQELAVYNQNNDLVTEKTNNGNFKITVDVGQDFNQEDPQTYTFSVAVLPEDASSLDIVYTVRTTDYEEIASIEKLESDTNKHTFVVTFKEKYFDKNQNINIDFTSTGSGTTRFAYLTLVSTIEEKGVIEF